MARLLVVYGTRPEAIKLAPVVRVLRDTDHAVVVCHTGQHPQTGIIPAHDSDVALDIVTGDQSLPELNARIQSAVFELCANPNQFEAVIVQGDTASAVFGAVAATLHSITVVHVEAGLRTGRFDEPWPEELHRVGLSGLATVHFAPTEDAAKNLRNEAISPDDIHVVGNTIVDAFTMVSANRTVGQVLVTAHRRENLQDNFGRIKTLISRCANTYPDMTFEILLHPNPAVQEALRPLETIPNITLHQPVPHAEFLQRLAQAWIVMTDSGGVQEEASILGTPCLVIRDATDRPELIAVGAARVVGRDADVAVSALRELQRSDVYQQMQKARTVFGDGRTSERIVDILETYL